MRVDKNSWDNQKYMKAAEKCVVVLSYQLQAGDANGEVVEKTSKEKPFAFLFGSGHLLPEFEQNIKGLETGNTFAFGVKKENAYGEPNPNAVVDLPKTNFVVDGKLAEELLEVGRIVPMRDQNGHPLNGRIMAVGADSVTLDFNHPMAGMDLYFTGEVLEVREATQEELDHGHAHGPGGHHH